MARATRSGLTLGAATLLTLGLGCVPAHAVDDPAVVTPSIGKPTVGQLVRRFQTTLPDVADGPPVYRAKVATASGPRNLLYVTTRSGATSAVDATSGAVVWTTTYGPGSCRINNDASRICYTTASPVLDPGAPWVYAYGLDGKVHKLAAGSGTEHTGGGWPEVATLKPFDEKGSSDLAVATVGSTSYLYVANGGYPGDRGDYQGHVTTIDLTTGAQRVFNTQCSTQHVHLVEKPGTPDCPTVQSAVWARPGVVYDTTSNRIFFVTGNGDYAPASGDWGDTVLALHPNGTGAGGGTPVDTYTPADYQHLEDVDADLGSTAPTILPAPAGSAVTDLAVQGGKDAMLRLLDLSDLSGSGGPGHTGGEVGPVVPVPQGGVVLSQPLAYRAADGTTWVVVVNGNGASGLKLTLSGSTPTLTPVWKTSTSGFTPVATNGVAFYQTSTGPVAIDVTTGAVLWRDTAGSTGVHWNAPLVAGGAVFTTDQSRHLTGYAVPK